MIIIGVSLSPTLDYVYCIGCLHGTGAAWVRTRVPGCLGMKAAEKPELSLRHLGWTNKGTGVRTAENSCLRTGITYSCIHTFTYTCDDSILQWTCLQQTGHGLIRTQLVNGLLLALAVLFDREFHEIPRRSSSSLQTRSYVFDFFTFLRSTPTCMRRKCSPTNGTNTRGMYVCVCMCVCVYVCTCVRVCVCVCVMKRACVYV